jgi:hypothetical protein
VKAGSIIPMGNYAVSTAFLSAESLTIHLYPGSDASFQLIEDDGISEFHRTKNEKRITNISYKQSTTTLTINASSGTYAGASDRRVFRVDVHGVDKNICAVVNGKLLKSEPSQNNINAMNEGTRWDKQRKILSIFLRPCTVKDPYTITLSGKCR